MKQLGSQYFWSNHPVSSSRYWSYKLIPSFKRVTLKWWLRSISCIQMYSDVSSPTCTQCSPNNCCENGWIHRVSLKRVKGVHMSEDDKPWTIWWWMKLPISLLHTIYIYILHTYIYIYWGGWTSINHRYLTLGATKSTRLWPIPVKPTLSFPPGIHPTTNQLIG